MTAPVRVRLPNRRSHETVLFEHEGVRFYGSFGRRYVDGSVGGRVEEVFLRACKPDSSLDNQACDAGVLASMLLQYGVPIEEIRHSLKRSSNGRAAGPLGALFDILIASEAT